jgi:hypothetical protein
MTTHDRATESPQRAGLILITIGLALLANQLFDLGGAFVLGAIAVVFFVALATTREYGFLIPAMIFTGIAAGVAATELGDQSGGAVVLGLGGAFLGVYVIGALFFGRPHWWPLIPGGILSTIGGSLILGGPEGVETVGRFWPLVLVVIGLLLLLGVSGPRRSQATRPEPRP